MQSSFSSSAEPQSPGTLQSAGNGEHTAWYLIHTKPRQENTALENLARQGYECYLPQIRKEKVSRRKAWVATEPMFARYLFIKLDSGDKGKSWAPIRSTTGVNCLVRFGTLPAKVDNALVDWLRHHEQTLATETLFTQGDAVTITAGPFTGIEAIFQTSDANLRSLILLEFLNKPVSMWVHAGELRKDNHSRIAAA